jgi:periplasmic nitrate reductase NapD
MNISGIVVSVSPEHFSNVLEELEKSPICDVHFNDEATTIIVTLEGEGVAEETEKLRAIQSMDHIISAEMSYSYSEDELEKLRQDVELKQGTVPEFLTNDDAGAEDADYGGDINKQLKRKH